MHDSRYQAGVGMPKQSKRKYIVICVVGILVICFGVLAYKIFAPTAVEKSVSQLQFDDSVTEPEKQTISDALLAQSISYDGDVGVSVKTSLSQENSSAVLSAYVPVTNKYSTRQKVSKEALGDLTVKVPADTDEKTRNAIANLLELDASEVTNLTTDVEEVSDTTIAFILPTQLTSNIKLLTFDSSYYLDSFDKGAIFRTAEFSGSGSSSLEPVKLNSYATSDETLKVNMTGVTALTRVMMRKLAVVKDAKYFSAKIGDFLADADITHVSNEVSFKEGCTYSDAVFCSPPEMIDALKDSGVDLVELTGNHNNDSGNQYNTDSINLYHSLGWYTFGGGLNTVEAAKPYIADKKQSKIAFLGYNYPDSPSGGAIAKESSAGANSFDFDKIKSDIASVKQQAGFVIVDVQFWECYAYPAGYVEYPICDLPIANQTETFRKIADLGADMVIGTQAHQPQTYEIYNGKPIYYGLGNLYFEQTQWPGTERGIILTNYFVGSKLVQTKLSPTVYDRDFQTYLMDNADAVSLLERLKTARTTAGL